MRAEISEPVHVELRVEGRVIVRDLEPGVLADKTEDDRAVAEQLLAVGLATRASRARKGEE